MTTEEKLNKLLEALTDFIQIESGRDHNIGGPHYFLLDQLIGLSEEETEVKPRG